MNLNSFTAFIITITFSLYIALPEVLMLEIGRYMNHTDKQILDHLLDPIRYDHRTRPAVKTVVNVSVLLLTLSSPDESSVTYEIGFIMLQMWDDPRVGFEDGGKHKYLNALMHANMLWMPDTYFIKHGEFKYPLDRFDPIHIALKIYPNGTVIYTTRRNMILTCEGNLKIFPFDSPKCFFAIESISHESEQLELRWDTKVSIKAADSIKTMNAYMMRNETHICNNRHTWRSEYSCLSVLLVFSRDKSFYFSTVFVPGMVLVTSSFISFWLDVNAVPARVMIAVTTMLNFCTTTNSFRSKLPVVSDLTAMNLWDFVCMFFIYASMIEFIIVNYLHRKLPHPSRPNSGDRQSTGGMSDYHHSFRHQPNSRKLVDSGLFQSDHIQITQNKEEIELKAPLVEGEDPSVPPLINQSNHRQQRPNRNRSFSDINQLHSPFRAPASGSTSFHEDERLRATASVFAWLRRPQILRSTELTSRARMARSIDHISKTVFTLLFGLFSFFYFLTYAVIKPAQLDDWIENEFELPSKTN
ncbi:glutamate-gated chloride channel-like [Oppia nitens]|uniref:glutamate-gated chloride channel-like n=1 Tax=Oppia nitens TaxID=1686743 RepID=UPI0023D987C9|nr:glutamate-gated chloride channel-like [Oppia nitens]